MAFDIAISIVGYTLFLVGMSLLFWPKKAFATDAALNLARSCGYGLWSLSTVQDVYVVYQTWSEGPLFPMTAVMLLRLFVIGLTPVFMIYSVKYYRKYRANVAA